MPGDLRSRAPAPGDGCGIKFGRLYLNLLPPATTQDGAAYPDAAGEQPDGAGNWCLTRYVKRRAVGSERNVLRHEVVVVRRPVPVDLPRWRPRQEVSRRERQREGNVDHAVRGECWRVGDIGVAETEEAAAAVAAPGVQPATVEGRTSKCGASRRNGRKAGSAE